MNIAYKKASIFYRLSAFIIDCLIISIAFTFTEKLIDDISVDLLIFKALFIPIYFIVLERNGTIGRRIFSLVLLKRETQKPELYTTVIRAILKILFFSAISCLFFGFLNHDKDTVDVFVYIFGGAYTALNLYYFFTKDSNFIHDSITLTSVYKEDKQ